MLHCYMYYALHLVHIVQYAICIVATLICMHYAFNAKNTSSGKEIEWIEFWLSKIEIQWNVLNKWIE